MSEPNIDCLITPFHPNKNSQEFEILLSYLDENPYSTVVDLEADKFEIVQFAKQFRNDTRSHASELTYLEINNRHQISEQTLRHGFRTGFPTKKDNFLRDFNCYARKITISVSKGKVISEVT